MCAPVRRQPKHGFSSQAPGARAKARQADGIAGGRRKPAQQKHCDWRLSMPYASNWMPATVLVSEDVTIRVPALSAQLLATIDAIHYSHSSNERNTPPACRPSCHALVASSQPA